MTSVSVTIMMIFKPPYHISEPLILLQTKTRLNESRCTIQFIAAPLNIQYSARSNTLQDQIPNNNSHTQKQCEEWEEPLWVGLLLHRDFPSLVQYFSSSLTLSNYSCRLNCPTSNFVLNALFPDISDVCSHLAMSHGHLP